MTSDIHLHLAPFLAVIPAIVAVCELQINLEAWSIHVPPSLDFTCP